ncbi:MAG: M28 family peptidase [Vulcanimicrobiota bacterium]
MRILRESVVPQFNEIEAFRLLFAQVELGPRYPGSAGHRALIDFISCELSRYVSDGRCQPFEVTLQKKQVQCINILGRVKGTDSSRKVLVGTHFDTRLIADREADPGKRAIPIPGANDGASGTAIMLEYARLMNDIPPPCDVILAFFDAEDVGDLDGNSFYEGSKYFSQNMGDLLPDEAIILDMVGGSTMCLDIDMNALFYNSVYGLPTKELLLRLYSLAHEFRYREFFCMKPGKFKYIGCDHIPLLEKMIPACVLIDIDYPEWHTGEDRPIRCSPRSLKAVGDVVLHYIYSPKAPLRPPDSSKQFFFSKIRNRDDESRSSATSEDYRPSGDNQET